MSWESGKGHLNIVHLCDWFPGFDGLDREIFLVLERCDFGLDDLIRGVRDCRSTYERRHQNMLDNASAQLHGSAASKNILN